MPTPLTRRFFVAGAVLARAETVKLEGAPVNSENPIFWEYNRAMGARKITIRDGDWKLLAHADRTTFELYHLRADATERHDLASKEPSRVRRMAGRLLEMRRDVNAAARE